MKKLLYIALLFAITFATGSCNDEKEQQRLSMAERERLRKEDSAALKVGVIPTSDCLPILVAKELRLFDTLDVDVHLRRYHAISECRYALVNKLVEGAVIDSTLLNELNGKEPWLYAPMKTALSWKFLTAKKARISRLDQMNDKMIAADGHGESRRLAEKAIDSLLRKKMLVFVVQVEDPAVRLDMLNNGNVDAALLPEPFATKAIKEGARHISSVKSSPAGVVAFRKEVMSHKTRKQQYESFEKAVTIARDSIKKYGEDNYSKLLEW